MAQQTQKIGEVTHYYTEIKVGTILLEKSLTVGDTIQIQGHTTDFTQEVDSIQFEHEAVETATAGQEIGLKVEEKVRQGDEVFLVQ